MNQILSKSYSIQDGERNLLSFDDIIFCPRDDDGYGIRIRFANGYGVSIQCGDSNYCSSDIERKIGVPFSRKDIPFERFTRFELALFDFSEEKEGSLIYAPNHEDVEGFLSKAEIWNRILQVKAGLLNRYEVS